MRRRRTGGLSRREMHAVWAVVARVRSEVGAKLLHVLLFGSRSRGEARPDSDIDLLLVFHTLPPDREPYATQTEEIADEVASVTGVPVTVWSVSRVDLEIGNRTPMLVDALDDGIPLWPKGSALPGLEFTPADALRCVAALLDRVDEGSGEVARHLRAGNVPAAAHRGRDDVVRLCTAVVLLAGETRLRRGEAVWRGSELLGNGFLDGHQFRIIRWAEHSFGPDGKDDTRSVPLPPGGFEPLSIAVDALWTAVAARAGSLERAMQAWGTPRTRRVYQEWSEWHPVTPRQPARGNARL